MSNAATILYDLKTRTKGYWAERIIAECEFALKLSLVKKGKYENLILEAAQSLQKSVQKNGAIVKADALKAEKILAPLAQDAKTYNIMFIGHAHIDMNWLWAYSETVAVTLETFRTMLKFLKEYPKFTFAQSQASVYRIVEKHEPEMLAEIKKYIKQGRWEVTASQWVEADKNTSNGEAQSRHLLYTKKYLSKLLDIDPDSMNIDFEPDTFGHNANVPEILAGAGVKYYYHCRALETDLQLYKWRAPSGAEVIVNRDILWYNGVIETNYALPVCEFCVKNGVDTMLRPYGVGDHGGGPTRRDIERIMEFDKWPVFPNFKFGTYHEYFAMLEKKRDSLPLWDKEINSVFTGCYTTQTRIKLANKIGESRVTDTDVYSSLAGSLLPRGFKSVSMFEAWENVLFNQFHDIVTGSGIIDTREYAMGIFQQSLAISNTQSARAMRAVSAEIDTSDLPVEDEDDSHTVSEGAGVGFSIESFGLPKTDRGRGKNRIIHFFNPSTTAFEGPCHFNIWDWPGDINRFAVYDSNNKQVACQRLGGRQNHYWGHEESSFTADVKIPALGYATYRIAENEINDVSSHHHIEFNEKAYSYALENDKLKVVFDTNNLRIISMIDKTSGAELIGAGGAGFIKINEDNHGMAAWSVGRYKKTECLHKDVRVNWSFNGELRSEINYHMFFGNGSKLQCTYTLDKGSSKLDLSVKVDWLEVGNETDVPQLSFRTDLGYNAVCGKYSIPMGIISRGQIDLDTPTNGLAAAVSEKGRSLCMAARGKYGYRLFNNKLGLHLMHSSDGPDRYPELGEHAVNFSLGVSETDNDSLTAFQHAYDHPVSYIHGTVHGGTLPKNASGITFDAKGVALSSIKPAEDGNGYIVRFYETAGASSQVTIGAFKPVISACVTDILENDGKTLKPAGGKVKADVKPYTVNNIRIVL